MGTSQSNPGPGGASPLVPPWADDNNEQDLDEPQQREPSNEEPSDTNDEPDKEPYSPLPEPRRFKSFRQDLGKFVLSGNKSSLRKSLGHYSRKASGGRSVAPKRLKSATKAGASLYGALTGLTVTDRANGSTFNISELSGLPSELAIARISQAFSGQDGDSEKIRVAMNHALSEALEGVEIFDLQSITPDIVLNSMINFLTEAVFLQIINDSAKAWNKAQSALASIRAENALRELIKVVVDEKLAPYLSQSLSISQCEQVQQQTIKEVWQVWENY